MVDADDDGPAEGPTVVAAIPEALGQLSSLEREALVLASNGDRDYREIGAILGLSPDAVARRLRLGLIHLQGYLPRDDRPR